CCKGLPPALRRAVLALGVRPDRAPLPPVSARPPVADCPRSVRVRCTGRSVTPAWGRGIYTGPCASLFVIRCERFTRTPFRVGGRCWPDVSTVVGGFRGFGGFLGLSRCQSLVPHCRAPAHQ